ncbi:hypothetical protein [Streptomyces termitum]|uniref:hypothetical protein n=1 Tax=Streptomyces termitum TaxID=67368 RepID=UPI0033BA0F6F
MKTCRSARRLPYAGLLVALYAAGAGEEEYPSRHDMVRRCELGEGHGDPHSAYLYAHDGGPELWARWEGETDEIRFVRLTPCEEGDPGLPPVLRSACAFPEGHACGHAWEDGERERPRE